MKKNLTLIILVLTLSSCNDLLISDDEGKGIDDILEFYGGYCKYSIGVSASTEDEDEDGKFFELELSKSEFLEKNRETPEMVTSNAAYRFYRNLDEGNKDRYSFIRGTILFANKETVEHDYSTKQLEVVSKNIILVERISTLINSGNYDSLANILNDQSVFRYDRYQLVKNLEKIDPQFGRITEFRPFGFKFTNAGNTKVLRISGAFIREVQNSEFSMWVNPKSNEVLKIDYKM